MLSEIGPHLGTSVSPLSSVPILNSLPGAHATLYLNFVGDYEASWGTYSKITTPAYDSDGDASTFSDAELAAIRSIWSYVAEDFSPFDLNVTTVAPASFAKGVACEIVIGGNGSWTGQSYGGISYVGGFTNSMPSVSFVFSANLENGNPRETGDAVSHEAGHLFGLTQQSSYSGTNLTNEYNHVILNGASPIMGYSYAATRSTWWDGTSDVSSTTIQDDMAVIAGPANGFGYRPESAGTTAATATLIGQTGDTVSASGVILNAQDVNFYSIYAGSGAATFTVEGETGYNNLLPVIQLYDATGKTLLASASSPLAGDSATITYNFSQAGSYDVVVSSEGDYGDAGQYNLSGTIVTPSDGVPVSAPSGLNVALVSSTQVQLTWVDNPSTELGYVVQRRVNGAAWTTISTLPKATTSYTDSSVSGGNTYSYQVAAYNPYSTSDPSNQATVVIAKPVTSPPAAVIGLVVSGRTTKSITLSWQNESSATSGYHIIRSLNNGRKWKLVAVLPAGTNSFTDTTVNRGRKYVYEIVSYNASGASTTTIRVSATVPLTAPFHLNHKLVGNKTKPTISG